MTTKLQKELTQDLEHAVKKVEQSLNYIVRASNSLYGEEVNSSITDRITNILNTLVHARGDIKRFNSELANSNILTAVQ